MRNLQDATERICELKGSLVAVDVLMCALVATLPAAARIDLARLHTLHAEAARAVLLHEPISEHTLAAFEHDVQRTAVMLTASIAAA